MTSHLWQGVKVPEAVTELQNGGVHAPIQVSREQTLAQSLWLRQRR